MYCCDLLLNLDGLTCTSVMGYAEGKVSHFVHALSDNIYTDMLPWKLRVTELWYGGF